MVELTSTHEQTHTILMISGGKENPVGPQVARLGGSLEGLPTPLLLNEVKTSFLCSGQKQVFQLAWAARPSQQGPRKHSLPAGCPQRAPRMPSVALEGAHSNSSAPYYVQSSFNNRNTEKQQALNCHPSLSAKKIKPENTEMITGGRLRDVIKRKSVKKGILDSQCNKGMCLCGFVQIT